MNEEMLVDIWLIGIGIIFVVGQVVVSLTDPDNGDGRMLVSFGGILWPLVLIAGALWGAYWGLLHKLPVVIQRFIKNKIEQKKVSQPISKGHPANLPREQSVSTPYRSEVCEKCGLPPIEKRVVEKIVVREDGNGGQAW